MQKIKKIMALALAMVMVIGGSMTAFAEEPTSGSSTGAGTSEGHVDKHVIQVVLPTVPEGSTPFAYTMDPERLIQETTGAKHTDAVFPTDAETDTGVYFLTGVTKDVYEVASDVTEDSDLTAYYTKAEDGETYTACDSETVYNDEVTYYEKTQVAGKNIFENTSSALVVTSKSSADVELTVEVEASQADTDIALVNEAPAAEVTDPQLYLALQLDGTDTAVKAGDKITQTVTIEGVVENFETVYADGAYKFAPKADLQETDWNSKSFTLTGAVSKATVTSTTTAPTLTVTWSYADPAAVPADVAPSATNVTYAGTGEIAIPYALGDATELTDISFVYNGNTFSKNGVNESRTGQATNISWDGEKITFNEALSAFFAKEDGATYTVNLYFDDATTAGATATITTDLP